MIEISQTYHRHEPGGRTISVDVRNAAEAKYHQSLVDKGYRYELLAHQATPDVDLPVLDTMPTKPRIHIGDSVCESCEG